MKIEILILAAGLGTRMGGKKMLTPFLGKPMLLNVVENALDAGFPVKVILGHDAENIKKILPQNIETLFNFNFAKGLSTSLQCGIRASNADGVFVMLGDMPLITGDTLKLLASHFKREQDIIVPTFQNQQGNPVLWGKAHFPKLLKLEGDKGAKSLFASLKQFIKCIEIENDSILQDFDSLEAFN